MKRKINIINEDFNKKRSTVNSKWWEIKFQDFTQSNSIVLLARIAIIISELFKCHKYLKTQFFAYLLILLAGGPCLCLMLGLDLTVSLAISRAELMGKKVAIIFSDIFCGRNWTAFWDGKLQIMVFKYFLL